MDVKPELINKYFLPLFLKKEKSILESFNKKLKNDVSFNLSLLSLAISSYSIDSISLNILIILAVEEPFL